MPTHVRGLEPATFNFCQIVSLLNSGNSVSITLSAWHWCPSSIVFGKYASLVNQTVKRINANICVKLAIHRKFPVFEIYAIFVTFLNT